jgi:ribosomal protein L11 methyltransferase
MAEAVAEVLARYVNGGVAIESTRVTADAEDEGGHAEGPLRVCGYLPVDGQIETTRRRLEEALWHLGQIRSLPEAQFRPIQEEDWAEAWKQHYRPVAIGERLLIVPAWLETVQPGRIPVKIDPGMAFGTGTHPTTQLCLDVLDEILHISLASQDRVQNNLEVIDVGCGSGILSIAALRLGAQHALAVDIDAEAVEAVRQNAALNQVVERIEIGRGSVGEILGGQFTIRRAPLVLANILAPVLVRLFGEGLGELVTPGGRLILSGILAEQAGEVLAASRQRGFYLEMERLSGDWVALVVKHEN